MQQDIETARTDFSFARDGVGIPDCLRGLVGDDAAVRRLAGERLWAMQVGVLSVHTDLRAIDFDREATAAWGGQGERFAVAVREAVKIAGFDREDFARRLCAFRIALIEDWNRRVEAKYGRQKRRDDLFDRLAEPVVAAIDAAGTEGAREQAIRRFKRIVAAYVCGNDHGAADPYDGAESLSPSGTMSFAIFGALGPELLAAPDGLEVMLGSRQMAGDALSALQRAGPAAVAFAPQLIARLDVLPSRSGSDPAPPYFDAAASLGSVGRGDPATIDALIARLDDPDDLVRRGAAVSLRHMDGDLCGRNSTVVDKLMMPRGDLDGLPPPPDVMTLASAAAHDPAVRALVARQLRTRPPEMRTLPNYPNQTYDAVTYQRGEAIEATRYLTAYPAPFVSLLVEALTTFEEYDPDLTYDGPCGRLADALARFGPAAAFAAVPLAERLEDESDASPRAICHALVAFGPAAAGAVPLLEAYRRRTADPDVPPSDFDGSSSDPHADLIGATIRQILGRPERHG